MVGAGWGAPRRSRGGSGHRASRWRECEGRRTTYHEGVELTYLFILKKLGRFNFVQRFSFQTVLEGSVVFLMGLN
jgi:hypothetical protein